jgi:D-alanyl-D-alanine carboxypeptidase
MVLAHRTARTNFFLRPNVIGALLGGFALAAIGLYATESTFQNAALSRIQQTAAVAATEDPFANIRIDARAAYVLDLKTGDVLYSRNPDAQLPLASLTKVPLAIAVSEVLAPDAAIKIPRYTTAQNGTSEHLSTGDIWRIKDILDFTLIGSSNDGADILAAAADPLISNAHAAAPRKGGTLWRMNDLARELDLKNTYFLNASGLDESVTQAGAYGSARDMAVLFAYAATEWPSVFAGTTKDGLLLTSVRGGTAAASNTNNALGSISGLIMGKTGLTDLAGGNLVIVFDVGLAHPVAAVVLGSTQDGRFEDMKHIVAATYAAIAARN